MGKLIGGTNGMHMQPDSHPFQSGGGKNIRPKLGKSAAAHPTAAGNAGNKQSANSQSKTSHMKGG